MAIGCTGSGVTIISGFLWNTTYTSPSWYRFCFMDVRNRLCLSIWWRELKYSRTRGCSVSRTGSIRLYMKHGCHTHRTPKSLLETVSIRWSGLAMWPGMTRCWKLSFKINTAVDRARTGLQTLSSGLVILCGTCSPLPNMSEWSCQLLHLSMCSSLKLPSTKERTAITEWEGQVRGNWI